MKRTYDFATIGFRPFTETQEFVTMAADMKTVLDALKTRFIDQDGLTVQQAPLHDHRARTEE
jgi:hypothetical protein